jgi:hypothetical protein
MSALGQKQTCAPQKVMSALPPRADMCSVRGDVCFGPKADTEASRSPRQHTQAVPVKCKAERLARLRRSAGTLDVCTDAPYLHRERSQQVAAACAVAGPARLL